MRIISKWFDYYDKALAYGADPNLIYVRNTNEEYIQNKFLYYGEGYQNRDCVETISFCGKLYSLIKFKLSDYVCGVNFHKIYYSIEQIEKDLLSQKVQEDFGEQKYAYQKLQEKLSSLIKKAEKCNYFHATGMVDHNLHMKYDAPIIHISYVRNSGFSGTKLVINPRLKDYNFISQVDPYFAFQEISMYLGNDLAKQVDPTVNFTDEMKRDIAGFDKWSFRKHKDD